MAASCRGTKRMFDALCETATAFMTCDVTTAREPVRQLQQPQCEQTAPAKRQRLEGTAKAPAIAFVRTDQNHSTAKSNCVLAPSRPSIPSPMRIVSGVTISLAPQSDFVAPPRPTVRALPLPPVCPPYGRLQHQPMPSIQPLHQQQQQQQQVQTQQTWWHHQQHQQRVKPPCAPVQSVPKRTNARARTVPPSVPKRPGMVMLLPKGYTPTARPLSPPILSTKAPAPERLPRATAFDQQQAVGSDVLRATSQRPAQEAKPLTKAVYDCADRVVFKGDFRDGRACGHGILWPTPESRIECDNWYTDDFATRARPILGAAHFIVPRSLGVIVLPDRISLRCKWKGAPLKMPQVLAVVLPETPSPLPSLPPMGTRHAVDGKHGGATDAAATTTAAAAKRAVHKMGAVKMDVKPLKPLTLDESAAVRNACRRQLGQGSREAADSIAALLSSEAARFVVTLPDRTIYVDFVPYLLQHRLVSVPPNIPACNANDSNNNNNKSDS